MQSSVQLGKVESWFPQIWGSLGAVGCGAGHGVCSGRNHSSSVSGGSGELGRDLPAGDPSQATGRRCRSLMASRRCPGVESCRYLHVTAVICRAVARLQRPKAAGAGATQQFQFVVTAGTETHTHNKHPFYSHTQTHNKHSFYFSGV